MAPAAIAAISAVVSVVGLSEQRKSRKSQESAQKRTETRLAEAERKRVKALKESEFATRERRRERRGGFGSTIGASFLGGSSIGTNATLGG